LNWKITSLSMSKFTIIEKTAISKILNILDNSALNPLQWHLSVYDAKESIITLSNNSLFFGWL